MRDLTQLPKAQLHVHLESTVRWSTLRELGDAHGVDIPEPPAAEPLRFAGFRAFGDYNKLLRSCLRKADDFTRVAREFCADEAAQGTRYVEVTLSAASHGERLGDLEMPLAAVLQGLAEGQAAYDIECQIIIDHSRRRSLARARQALDLATRFAADGVVAIGLAGDDSYPLEPFVDVVRGAAAGGLHLVHHAGETSGPQSIWEAITVGQAERIGHGVTALADAELVAVLRDRRIAIEACPLSNVALGVCADLASHPLDKQRAAGLIVTISTDIPNLTGSTLSGELGAIRETFSYDDGDIASLNLAAIDASFASSATKARLRTETAAWLAQPA